MNGETEGSLEGFVFDPAVCRRAFDHYDKDKSGFLDAKEIMKLADVRNSIFSHRFTKISTSDIDESLLVSRSFGTHFFPKDQNYRRQIRRYDR